MSKALNINFSDEKLDLDYLVFNLPRFRTRMLKVAKIFHKYGFNSRTYNADTENYLTILYQKTFTHWFIFTLENELWDKDNLSIHFKASNFRKIYFFIKEAEGSTYIHIRTQIALCILAITDIRINELLPLKVNQLKNLVEENWIAINQSKREPSNHKAFLTKEGKKIIQDRKKDFQFILLIKEPDAYIFSSETNPF